MKRIAVVGYKGKMGGAVFNHLKTKGFAVVGVDKDDSLEDLSGVGLVIDFGGAESSAISAKWCEKNGIAIIIGSTGQTDEQNKIIESASKKVAVLKAGNFSIGIYMLKKMMGVLKDTTLSSICVFEKHHAQKVDCPSGTAIELGKVIYENFGIEPQMLSERGGKEIGTHMIDFYFADEVISVSHKAFSREAFVLGVVRAVEFMLRQSDAKQYCFEDIFDK